MKRTAVRFISLFFVVFIISAANGNNEEDATCQDATQSERRAMDDSCSLENVILLDGVPDGNDNVLLDGSQRRTTSLVQDEPAGFSKVSRVSQVIPPKWLFISANGDHEGWFVYVPQLDKCHLHLAKRLVAREIVASYDYDDDDDLARQVDLKGPHRLVDEEGKPFPDQSTSNRLHLLLPREAFIHAAVAEGYVRTLSDGSMTLTTMSLEPRVFLVDSILSLEDCEELIRIASKTWHKSPEKHYSDAYKNYRTSWTGSTPSNAPITRKLWQRVSNLTAMPDGGVESPQLLKYDQDSSWYKQHHDFFHHFASRPLEEVRMFVQTRARELLRRNVSVDITTLIKDESSITNFDNIHRRLPSRIAEKLAEGLDLDTEDDVSAGRLIHDFLMTSSDPKRDFDAVAVLYASDLLDANGASNSKSLAERYFRFDLGDELYPYYLEDYVPYFFKHIQSNRHVTVLPILRAAERGGNTVFPQAASNRMGMEPDPDEEFAECKQGLVLKAVGGQALMFYNRLPRGDLDYQAQHAGCPPKSGEKFAVNCFTWDSDRTWANQFLSSLDVLYG